MENLKEKWNAIDQWYKTQDPKKLKYLCKERLYDDGKPAVRLQITIGWYEAIKELSDLNKDYIFGDKIVTLKDISDYMISVLPNEAKIKKEIKDWENNHKKDEDDEDYYDDEDIGNEHQPYDSCGHSSHYGTLDVINFWKKLDKNKILAVAGGATIDEYEIDINGGRSYYMSQKNIHEMIFNYLYYTLDLSSEKFDKNICNSCDTAENLGFYYSGKVYAEKGLVPYLPTVEEVEEMYNKLVKRNNEDDVNRFNYMLKNIIEQFEKKEIFRDKVEILKTLKIK